MSPSAIHTICRVLDHTDTYRHTHTLTHTHTLIQAHTDTHTHAHTYIHTHITHIHTHRHTHLHTHTYTLIHINTHIHTWAREMSEKRTGGPPLAAHTFSLASYSWPSGQRADSLDEGKQSPSCGISRRASCFPSVFSDCPDVRLPFLSSAPPGTLPPSALQCPGI